MRKLYLFIFTCLLSVNSLLAQINPVALGKITYRELQMKDYPADSAAHAVVLQETGEAYMDADDGLKLILHYYCRIKVLDEAGLEAANIAIPMYTGKSGQEEVLGLQAVTYNLEGGQIVKSELSPKDVYEEESTEYYRVKKFSFPNVKPGSVLEYKFRIESPLIFNFREWVFQQEHPTVRSEYWARIPGNFIYNIRLVGGFELSQNESEISKGCFRIPGQGLVDCALFKWAMDSIPAFIEEDYMTAPSDFLPAIRFELSEVRRPDGQVDKLTKTWKDLDGELRVEKNFGLALKKAQSDMKQLPSVLAPESAQPLEKARKIYDHFQEHFAWNNHYGPFASQDLGKAYAAGSGSVGDINLNLVAALQAAGLEAHPALLSTRENGYAVDIHPVITDFNYVVAFVRVDGKEYLLDAAEEFLPFGMLPYRCLTDKVRVMDFQESYWKDVPAGHRFREMTRLELELNEEGGLGGRFSAYKYDYEALQARQEISGYERRDDYVRELEKEMNGVRIVNYTCKGLDSLEGPLVENYELDFSEAPVGGGGKGGNIYLDAFLLGGLDENPFKLKERYYPVDFGAGWEIQQLVSIRVPESYKVASFPESMGLNLPADGGSFVMNVSYFANQGIHIISRLSLKKKTYSSDEYYYLKELFTRMIQAHASTIVLEPK